MITYSRSMQSESGDTVPLFREKRYVITSLSSHSEDVVRELIQNEPENMEETHDEDKHFHTSINDTTYEQIKGVPECNCQDSEEKYEKIQL